MSTAKAKASAAAPERVSVSVPRGGEREDPNLFVGINGMNYLLPKGKGGDEPEPEPTPDPSPEPEPTPVEPEQ